MGLSNCAHSSYHWPKPICAVFFEKRSFCLSPILYYKPCHEHSRAQCCSSVDTIVHCSHACQFPTCLYRPATLCLHACSQRGRGVADVTCTQFLYAISSQSLSSTHYNKPESNSSTWTCLHVLSVRVGAVLEVGHTRVHCVLGKHLLSLQVHGGCGQEEIERWPVYYNYDIVQLAVGEHVVRLRCSTQHPSMTYSTTTARYTD